MSIERFNTIRLVRQDPANPAGIWGRLKIVDLDQPHFKSLVEFDTLERPWLDNRPNVSCIPKGTYPLRKKRGGTYYRSYSSPERFGHPYVVEVAKVPGRSAILFHGGNTIEDIEGCILPGVKTRRKPKFIAHSRRTYAAFFARLSELWEMVDGPMYLEVSDKGK